MLMYVCTYLCMHSCACTIAVWIKPHLYLPAPPLYYHQIMSQGAYYCTADQASYQYTREIPRLCTFQDLCNVGSVLQYREQLISSPYFFLDIIYGHEAPELMSNNCEVDTTTYYLPMCVCMYVSVRMCI